MRLIVPLLVLLWSPMARAGDVLAAVRTADWVEADRLAASVPDPVARKLVLFYRLLTPGAARSAEIAQFMADSPDWPSQGLLSQRLAEALAADRDDLAVLTICKRRPADAAPSLLRCAEAAERTAREPDADARRAWLVGITDAAAETAFMRRWGRVLTLDDQRRRFERLAWTERPNPGGTLARQAVRLDPPHRPGAEARLALRRDDPAGPSLFAHLSPAAQAEPGLVLDLARWFRRANRDIEAAQVWTGRGAAAEQAAPPERQALFWEERNIVARRLLRAQQDQLAYDVAALPTPAKEARLDAEFLAGWIALRRLERPEQAELHFRSLASLSPSAITQGRALYWLGRGLAASGQGEAAEQAYRSAAGWPTTFYGQLAILALGTGEAGLVQRLRTANPGWTEDRALELVGSELVRAATLLTAWGDRRKAKPFLHALEDRAQDPAGRAIAARLAADLGLPDQAVAAARRAGRDGIALPGSGWPEAAEPPPGRVERAVALGVIRQESSFDPEAGSPVGARGLMQLMPATAAQVARELNEPMTALTDAGFNMRLGTVYLAGLLDRFGALPPALAAYNAGPNRVREWLAANGDPAAGKVDPIDWIELIPFNETRNYVQRVVENVVIYRARHGAEGPHPVLRWGAAGT